MHRSVLAAATTAIILATAGSARAADLTEGFDQVVPPGWATANNAASPGTISPWFQGNSGVFGAHEGAPTAYAAANFNAVTGANTISSWLVSPRQETLSNGDGWSFFTRKLGSGADFPDRLEVRLSTNGGCSPGSGPTAVGDFTTVLTTVNPSLITGVYPTSWTRFAGTLADLPAGTSSGCIAFRYFVTDGGPSGANSDYIGLDTVGYVDDPAAPALTATAPGSPSPDPAPRVTGTAPADATVRLYADATCTGTAIGSGTTAELATGGIEAGVTRNATTAIRATATVGTRTSPCSTALSYRHDDVAPGAPDLTSTEPGSPADEPTPKVVGTAEADTTVRLYTSDTCTGAPVATGTADELAAGIQAAVALNATTTLRATATDAAGNVSACSTGLAYRHDDLAPGAPDLTATRPASPSNDPSPRVVGTAEAGSTVRLYTDDACAGRPVATGTAAELADGIAVVALANHTTTIRAIAEDAAGNASACSPGLTYVHDDVAPDAPVLSGTDPASGGASTRPRLVGTAEAAGTVRVYADAACAGPVLAEGTAADLASPGLVVEVPRGATTTLHATVTDAAGNASGCSTGRSYRQVDPVVETPAPAPAPPVTPAPGPSGPAAPAPCAVRGLVLHGVQPVLPSPTPRVRVTGTTDPATAGSSVAILRDGRRVGRTTVREDGVIRALVPAPRSSAARDAARWSLARGAERSARVASAPRAPVLTEEVSVTGGIRLRGRVPGATAPRTVVLTSASSCDGRAVGKSRSVRTDRRGRFVVALPALVDAPGVTLHRLTSGTGAGRTLTVPVGKR